MLCIEIWSLDSTEHIQVDATWVSPMLVWTEEDSTRIEVSAELFLGIEVTCRNVSEGIEIWSEYTPKIEVWTSYVCHIGNWRPYIYVIPDAVKFPCTGNTIKTTLINSNINWFINETNKK